MKVKSKMHLSAWAASKSAFVFYKYDKIAEVVMSSSVYLTGALLWTDL